MFLYSIAERMLLGHGGKEISCCVADNNLEWKRFSDASLMVNNCGIVSSERFGGRSAFESFFKNSHLMLKWPTTAKGILYAPGESTSKPSIMCRNFPNIALRAFVNRGIPQPVDEKISTDVNVDRASKNVGPFVHRSIWAIGNWENSISDDLYTAWWTWTHALCGPKLFHSSEMKTVSASEGERKWKIT